MLAGARLRQPPRAVPGASACSPPSLAWICSGWLLAGEHQPAAVGADALLVTIHCREAGQYHIEKTRLAREMRDGVRIVAIGASRLDDSRCINRKCWQPVLDFVRVLGARGGGVLAKMD